MRLEHHLVGGYVRYISPHNYYYYYYYYNTRDQDFPANLGYPQPFQFHKLQIVMKINRITRDEKQKCFLKT